MNLVLRKIILLGSVLCLFSCGKEVHSGLDDGRLARDGRTRGKDVTVISKEDGSNKLNGTVIDTASTLYGLVTDAVSGEGISGVPVTDGYTYSITDENGVYQMVCDTLCRVVYYSLPSGYEVDCDPSLPGHPVFWKEPDFSQGAARVDFSLTPCEEENDYKLVMVTDPQVRYDSHVSRWKNETVKDMSEYVAGFDDAYAFMLGDIVYSASNLFSDMRESMSTIGISGGTMPMFACAGNHDHEAPADDDYGATATFVSYFGPTDYSLNRGKAHIVVMDNVIVTSYSTSGLPNGYAWSYEGGITSTQLEWLKQDLATVDNPEETLLILCTHIPYRWGAYLGSASVNYGWHYKDVLSLLTQFKESHIMVGHTHASQNYIHSDYVCAGGQPIYEHIHGSADGSHWKDATSCCFNGTPAGYAVYDVSGNQITGSIYKGTGCDESFQMRVYDGNQVYTGSKGYEFSWYGGGKGGSNSAEGIDVLKGAFIAEIWGSDDAYWEVEFWQNGSKVGSFEKLPEGAICNMAFAAFYSNEIGSETRITSTTGNDFWAFMPESLDPSSENKWEVRAIQTLPSGTVKTYTCNTLTKDYNSFK